MIRRTITLVLVIITAWSLHVTAGEPGTSGFMFLRLGDGARASGMGEAFSAVADDATSVYWNPAGMANVEGLDLNISHTEWLVDIRFEQVSFVNEMFGGAVGLHFTGVYYGELERYGETPTLTPDGTFSPYSLGFAAGYAGDILPNLSLGGTAKLIYERIDFESATGWAVDFGLMHRSMIEGLTLAAAVYNLGPQARFVEEKFYPPFQFRAGAAYEYIDDRIRGGLILSADAVFNNDTDAKVCAGGEYNFREILSVRAGYKANYNVQGVAIGFGIKYRNLKFDYAYMPIEYELGNSHRISLSVYSTGE